jgi:hypothetical protein
VHPNYVDVFPTGAVTRCWHDGWSCRGRDQPEIDHKARETRTPWKGDGRYLMEVRYGLLAIEAIRREIIKIAGPIDVIGPQFYGIAHAFLPKGRFDEDRISNRMGAARPDIPGGFFSIDVVSEFPDPRGAGESGSRRSGCYTLEGCRCLVGPWAISDGRPYRDPTTAPRPGQ